jgi:hypothetical protein
MNDHPAEPLEPHMDTPDPLNDQLVHLADAIAVDDSQMSLNSVRDTAARRRRRRSVIVGTAAVAALVGGVLVVGGVTGNDESNTVAIDGADAETPTTDEANGSADNAPAATPAETASSDDVPVSSPSIATTRVETLAANSTPISIGSNDETAESQLEWIVPWHDGFLAGRVNDTPQPLPTELPEEISALFSQEVLDLFADGLPPTINEATAILSEAGLLDEVTAVLAANPEANDAVFSVESTDPDASVLFSTNGIEWEPIDFTTPEGSFGLYGIQSTGSRLAVATQTFAPPPLIAGGNLNDQVGDIIVATTTDLINWDITTVVVGERPADLPDVYNYSVSPGTLAITDSGWVLPTNIFSDIDIDALLPDDVRNRLQNGGGGYSTGFDDSGITVEIMGDYPAETTAQESGDEFNFSEPPVIESLNFTWEELGVDPQNLDDVGQRPESQVFASAWGGTPVLVEGINAWSVVAGGDGFYSATGDALDYSPDGVTWTSLKLPVGDLSVGIVKALPDAALVFAGDDDGATQVFRVSGADDQWELLDIPGAPIAMWDVFGNGSSASAMLVDGKEPVIPEPTEITVESDGYTLVMGQDRSIATVIVTNASGELITAEEHDWQSNDEPTSWQYGRTGINIIDPESGDVIVTFGNDLLEQADNEQTNRNDQFQDFDPDLWLVATVTGDRWLIEDLDTTIDFNRAGPGSLAINGNTLIVSIGAGDGWQRYDLS